MKYKQNLKHYTKIFKLIKTSQFDKTKGLGTTENQVLDIKASIKTYNGHLKKQEIQAWVWHKHKTQPMKGWEDYFVHGKHDIHNLIKQGFLFVVDRKLYNAVPLPVFLFGNIYDRIIEVKKQEQFITETFGWHTYNNHLEVLHQNKPKPLSVTTPKKEDRLFFLPNSDFAKEITLKNLSTQADFMIAPSTTLEKAFIEYLQSLPSTAFKGVDASEIIDFYLYLERRPARVYDDIEWRQVQKQVKKWGDHYFDVFLHQMISYEDQLAIDYRYNRTFNAIPPVQHTKVPIAFTHNKTFLGKPLKLRPVQLEALAFSEVVGSYILAYDVGLGKTLTAIAQLSSALASGKCKRPLLVVPNPVYKNWLKEMFGVNGMTGLLSGTGIKLNDWYNLSKPYLNRIDKNKPVEENTITIVTYEGFSKIALSQTNSTRAIIELSLIIDQETIATARDDAQNVAKAEGTVGQFLKNTEIDADTLGFDALVIDEAHNFKKVFASVKSADKDKKQFFISAGTPSNRGIRAFILANYTQKNYGQNVVLLTATPFTNSPLEIYSMLSCVSYEYMKENYITNITRFFQTYVNETIDYAITASQSIESRAIVKGFNSLQSLRNLIFSHVLLKDGTKDVFPPIPRPHKLNIPKIFKKKEQKDILSYLQMTPEQADIQKQINDTIQKAKNKGDVLRGLSDSLKLAISTDVYYDFNPRTITPKEFIKSSPKLMYTVGCMKTVLEHHKKQGTPRSCQIIYMNLAKDYFGLIKTYLEEELGFKKNIPLAKRTIDEVEILTGSTTTLQKEKIKEAFNQGICKVIIGTSTIKEGINLQTQSTVLYNLSVDWNPTDFKQLEGRIFRQGNQYGAVRIVTPLVENSSDVFVFQKLQEKQQRINAVLSKPDGTNYLEEEDLATDEIRFALITDMNVLTEFEIKKESSKITVELQILSSILEKINEYEENLKEYTANKKELIEIINIEDPLERINPHDDKSLIKKLTMLEAENPQYYRGKHLRNFKRHVSELNFVKRIMAERNSKSIEDAIQNVTNEKEALEDKRKYIASEEYYNKTLQIIKKKKEALAIKGSSVSERIKEFADYNHLLELKMTDIDPTHGGIEDHLNPQKSIQQQAQDLDIAKAKALALKIKLNLLKSA